MGDSSGSMQPDSDGRTAHGQTAARKVSVYPLLARGGAGGIRAVVVLICEAVLFLLSICFDFLARPGT